MSPRRYLPPGLAIHWNDRRQSGRRDCDSAAVGNDDAGDAGVAPAEPGQQQLLRAQVVYRHCFRP